MRNIWKYLLVGLLVFGLAIVIALPFFRHGFGFYNGYGMMRNWGFGPMMGGFGFFGIWMMLLGFLIPVGIITLAVLGVIALLRRPVGTIPPFSQAPGRTCPNCGKPAQADWKTCPYCGQTL